MGNRSISIGGNSVASVANTGDRVRIDASVDRSGVTSQQDGGTVEIIRELAALRALLEKGQAAVGTPIRQAIADAQAEAQRQGADKDKIGKSILKALEHAKAIGTVVEQGEKIAPHLKAIAAWLGGSWEQLLRAGTST